MVEGLCPHTAATIENAERALAQELERERSYFKEMSRKADDLVEALYKDTQLSKYLVSDDHRILGRGTLAEDFSGPRGPAPQTPIDELNCIVNMCKNILFAAPPEGPDADLTEAELQREEILRHHRLLYALRRLHPIVFNTNQASHSKPILEQFHKEITEELCKSHYKGIAFPDPDFTVAGGAFVGGRRKKTDLDSDAEELMKEIVSVKKQKINDIKLQLARQIRDDIMGHGLANSPRPQPEPTPAKPVEKSSSHRRVTASADLLTETGPPILRHDSVSSQKEDKKKKKKKEKKKDDEKEKEEEKREEKAEVKPKKANEDATLKPAPKVPPASPVGPSSSGEGPLKKPDAKKSLPLKKSLKEKSPSSPPPAAGAGKFEFPKLRKRVDAKTDRKEEPTATTEEKKDGMLAQRAADKINADKAGAKPAAGGDVRGVLARFDPKAAGQSPGGELKVDTAPERKKSDGGKESPTPNKLRDALRKFDPKAGATPAASNVGGRRETLAGQPRVVEKAAVGRAPGGGGGGGGQIGKGQGKESKVAEENKKAVKVAALRTSLKLLGNDGKKSGTLTGSRPPVSAKKTRPFG